MLKKFFIICSGADTDILNTCGTGEQNKYAGIGATVFFTAVMASIACSYALFTVFENVFTAIGFGVIWGLLIFNLDRFIVSTIKKRNSKITEIFQAVPRLILAVIIAIVISKPLELKLFEKEINQVILQQKNDLTLANKKQLAEQFSPNIEVLEAKISNLNSQLTTKTVEVNTLYDTYISEAEGTSGTKLLGKGPVYQEKRDKHDAAFGELQQLKTDTKAKIGRIENQIEEFNSGLKDKIEASEPIIAGFDGLMARTHALNQLPWLPSFFIFLLFLAVETSPIFAKLISAKGEFDYKLEDAETAVKFWVEQKVNQRKMLLETDQQINSNIYNAIAEEDELYNYKRTKARELMTLQADTFFQHQKNAL